MQVFADAARAQLVSITSNSMVVSSGARFPVANRGTAEDLSSNTWFKLVLAYGEDYEICYVKTHTGNGTFTNVERGKEGTTARTWAVDKQQTTAFIAPVAGDMAGILAAIQTLQDAKLDAAAVGSAPNQVPSNQNLGALAFLDAVGVTQLLQHTPDAAPGSTWKQVVGDSFEEKLVKPNGEVVDISPITQIRAFGLGVRQLSDPTSPEPIYLYPSSVVNTSPTQFIAALASDTVELSGKPVENIEFAGVSVSRGLRPVQFGVSGRGHLAQFWYRGYTTHGSLDADWKRLADLNSPVFTGVPSAPNLKLGNVASANVNTLDHYEEGTFTPSLRGKTTSGASTYSNQDGRYTRIGNRVFWEVRIILSSWSGMVGQLQLSGLPFNVANDTASRGAVTIGYFAGFTSVDLCDTRAFYNSGTATIDLLKRKLSESVMGAYPSEDLTQTAQIYLSGHYRVN